VNTVIVSKSKELIAEITKYTKGKCPNNNIVYLISFKDIVYNFENDYMPHMIFIDIEDKNINLQKLCSDVNINNEMAKIILVCSDDYYAVKAFEMGIFYYIVKPIDEKQISKVFSKWEKFYNVKNDYNI
jgi:DNA-binding LytR/AlgR family response regulator